MQAHEVSNYTPLLSHPANDASYGQNSNRQTKSTDSWRNAEPSRHCRQTMQIGCLVYVNAAAGANSDKIAGILGNVFSYLNL